MPDSTDYLGLSRSLLDDYRLYLETSFPLRDQSIAQALHKALVETRLDRGPYIETTHSFPARTLLADIMAALNLHPDEGFLQALGRERRLYRHQEAAIRAALAGRSVVVATGTGSGKTESFLLPILLDLYRSRLQGVTDPGIRAIVLYPMNALARDQRDRLAAIAKSLKDHGAHFSFTFGEYVGATPENARDDRRGGDRAERQRAPGELVFRDEMRVRPPDILLTNYSMLEYLLVRPKDSPLFDDGAARHLRYLVLDEAHQYRGVRGAEMAMLLRRLRIRCGAGGATDNLVCIATSATLAGEDEAAGAARFAAELFGSTVLPQDVLFAEPSADPPPADFSLAPVDYSALRHQGSASARTLLGRFLSDTAPSDEDALRVLLNQDARVQKLRKAIQEGPQDVLYLADHLFPGLPTDQQKSHLADMLFVVGQCPTRETPEGQASSVLSLRYHYFLRAIGGAFVTFTPTPQVHLERGSRGDGAAFELAICRACGQHYLVGRNDHGFLCEADRDPSSREHALEFWMPLSSSSSLDEEEDDSQASGADLHFLCSVCGQIWPEGGQGCHHSEMPGRLLRVRQAQTSADGDGVQRCLSCGYRSQDPVHEFQQGSDATTSVMATALHAALPKGRERILAFSDSRQQAAYFSWYLANTQHRISERSHLLQVLLAQSEGEEISLADLADLYAQDLAKEVQGPSETRLHRRKLAATAVYREFLSDEGRLSLQGLGLVRWRIAWPAGVEALAEKVAPRLSFKGDEWLDLLQVLLDSLRHQRAVDLDGQDCSWDDVSPHPTRFAVLGPRRGRANAFSFDSHLSRRALFLQRLLQSTGLPAADALDEAMAMLGKLLERTLFQPSLEYSLFRQGEQGVQLDPTCWRVNALRPDDALYRCNVCGEIQSVSVRGLCARPRCPGSLDLLSVAELPHNHYRNLYRRRQRTLNVAEHTAQIGHEEAAHLQHLFRSGSIDVLSSSTTFELGVDLGDLDVVFLRNVPPEPFNYAQRVGRAGRRAGSPGYALSHCGRTPHDLYHFRDPWRMLRGHTRAPRIALKNEKVVRRHLVATVLSQFFRAHPERFGSALNLLVDPRSPRLAEDLRTFSRANDSALTPILQSLAPVELHIPIGLHDGSWPERLWRAEHEDLGALDRMEASFTNEWLSLEDYAQKAFHERRGSDAAWAQGRQKQMETEDVLSLLSRGAVIPKYGFPTDVVELDIGGSDKSVTLERDLRIAVAEYAPTSEVVAHGKTFVPYGLKVMRDRRLPQHYLRHCPVHGYFFDGTREDGGGQAPACCDLLQPRRPYLIPEFGFTTQRGHESRPTTGRPRRLMSTRPFFIGFEIGTASALELPQGYPLLVLDQARPGVMGVLSPGPRGQGFFICEQCGAGFAQRKKEHRTPWGNTCSGIAQNFSLGHEFVTDIMQLRFLSHVAAKAPEHPGFWLSLAQAIASAAAEVLEVPESELASYVAPSSQPNSTIIYLYDDVPGGAGLVRQLGQENLLHTVLVVARQRVDGSCGCGEDTSCYGCLRTYRNQYAHTLLARGPVYDFLSQVLAEWRSTNG